jgi:hypothetical protein
VAAGIQFKQAKAEDAVPSFEEGHLICNPPYGERMGTVEESEALYRRLGEMAARFTGWGLGFVTNRSDFGDFFGRYAPTAKLIVNGAEEQWFHWYPAGSEGKQGAKPAPRRESRSSDRAPSSGASSRPEAPRRPWVGPDKPGWKSGPKAGPKDSRKR